MLKKTKAVKQIRSMPNMRAKANQDGEIRVTYRGLSRERAEELAYYTTDPEDAVETARLMANHDPNEN